MTEKIYTLAEIDAIEAGAARRAYEATAGWDPETARLAVEGARRYCVSWDARLKATYETCPTCGHVIEPVRPRA